MVDLESENHGGFKSVYGHANPINHSNIYEDNYEGVINDSMYGGSKGYPSPVGLRRRIGTGSFVNPDDDYGDEIQTGRESDGGKDGLPLKDKDSSGDEHANLLQRKRRTADREPVCYSFRRFFGWVISREKRTL